MATGADEGQGSSGSAILVAVDRRGLVVGVVWLYVYTCTCIRVLCTCGFVIIILKFV